VDVHPYRAAWQTRDLNAWAEALDVDVVMYSPVFKTPFRGREAAVELFGVLFEALGEVRITDEFVSGDSHAFFWRADAGGRWIEGTDLLRRGEDGKIVEITVMVRPLVGIAAFAGAVGQPLAAKRGAWRAAVLRLLTPALKATLAVADVVASRLVQRG
jgi:ketosteroid isomerase-like protein